ncbi:PREDICTED: uncharacterized protein LOC109363035 isoform X2 [Lupinus angustifolius]|uniref:uncharacterized protein LOC109363035 isoform X2 n=1 Tax=Lupinus angustifolius TaxID=3871 RepID=UPI00092FC5D7|nr:PREDICTED: uncharacterized protein LOC109363035 isoform X2 [Lupinus angustifolius]
MALLGMGANVQDKGYFPGYSSTNDLSFDSEGSTWTSSNVNTELKNDRRHIGSWPVLSPCNILGCNKELLKQTILKQEAVFRDQIHELHRIYNMQRELMDGIRRNELCKHNLRLEASRSSSSLSSKNAQKICFSPNLPWSTGQSSALIDGSIRLPMASAQKKSRQICPGPAPSVTEESLKDSKVAKYRKIGKKILDLQLPADEYIDSEEGECLENDRVTEMLHVSGYSLNRISQVVHDSNDKPHGTKSHGFADLNVPRNLKVDAAAKSYDLGGLAHHRKNSFYDLSKRITLGSQNFPNDVIQNLNKRPGVEAFSANLQPNPEKKHEWLSNGENGGILDSFGKERKFSSGEGSGLTQGSASNGMPGPSCASHTGFPFHIVSGADIVSSGFSPAELWKTPVSDFGQSSIAVQELGTNDPNKFHNSGSSYNHELVKHVKGSEDVGTCKNLNLNITPGDYSDTPVSQRIQITGEENGLQDSIIGLSWLKEKPVWKGKPHVSSDLQCFEVLPSEVFRNQSKTRSIEEIERGCIFDVTSPREHVPHLGNQMSADKLNKSESLAGLIDLNSCMIGDKNKPMDVDFKAPVSPENKECSPPRGESDENQLEVLVQSAEQEDAEVQEEPVRIAAEALVSISGFVAHDSLQITTCSSSESFLSNPLNWFAGIVSATVNHPENEIEEDFSCKAKNLKEFLLDGMDYFEYVTLNLTETKVDNYCRKSDGQTEQVSRSTSPAQLKKCRTNRGRWRKDFQNEILPSLASLSRYEVTEDLQTIGGLIAGGTHSEIGSLRSSGKNALARRSKQSCASISNNTNLKKLTNSTKLGIEKRVLTSWGKGCRKRRGQRVPTTNPKFILRNI